MNDIQLAKKVFDAYAEGGVGEWGITREENRVLGLTRGQCNATRFSIDPWGASDEGQLQRAGFSKEFADEWIRLIGPQENGFWKARVKWLAEAALAKDWIYPRGLEYRHTEKERDYLLREAEYTLERTKYAKDVVAEIKPAAIEAIHDDSLQVQEEAFTLLGSFGCPLSKPDDLQQLAFVLSSKEYSVTGICPQQIGRPLVPYLLEAWENRGDTFLFGVFNALSFLPLTTEEKTNLWIQSLGVDSIENRCRAMPFSPISLNRNRDVPFDPMAFGFLVSSIEETAEKTNDARCKDNAKTFLDFLKDQNR